MCVILVKPDKVEKSSITRETLYNCWVANPHGAGIMFAYRGKLIVWKGLMTFAKFMDAWNMVPQRAVLIAHFRIATHGGKDEANTHPFWITRDELAVVHNGILPIKAREDANLSDTATFVEDVLKTLPPGWIDDPATMHLMDGYIGHSNKLVFLSNDGRVVFLNETAGVWEKGCWYSNHSFRPVIYTTCETFKPSTLRERWSGKTKKLKKPDAHSETAKSIVTAARGRHNGDDSEVARELGITVEELRELVLGREDEDAIRKMEAQVERDRLESGKD